MAWDQHRKFVQLMFLLWGSNATFETLSHGMGPAPEVWPIYVSALAFKRDVQNFVAWHVTSTKSWSN
jgi:hypothetical protein